MVWQHKCYFKTQSVENTDLANIYFFLTHSTNTRLYRWNDLNAKNCIFWRFLLHNHDISCSTSQKILTSSSPINRGCFVFNLSTVIPQSTVYHLTVQMTDWRTILYVHGQNLTWSNLDWSIWPNVYINWFFFGQLVRWTHPNKYWFSGANTGVIHSLGIGLMSEIHMPFQIP